jgi:hypothetical protein
MFIVLVLAAAVAVALLRGGRLSALTDLPIRHIWLFFIPLILQLIIFLPFGASLGQDTTLTKAVYLFSMAIGAVVLLLNRHLPGATWIAAGLMLNLLVITVNGGFMPVSAEARQIAGRPPVVERSNNVVPLTDQTLLPWLADIIPLPSWLPFSNVMSIGDALIMFGAFILIQRALRPPQQTPSAPDTGSAS